MATRVTAGILSQHLPVPGQPGPAAQVAAGSWPWRGTSSRGQEAGPGRMSAPLTPRRGTWHSVTSPSAGQRPGLMGSRRLGGGVSPGVSPESRGVLGHQHSEAQARQCAWAVASGSRRAVTGPATPACVSPLVTETPQLRLQGLRMGVALLGGSLLVEQALPQALATVQAAVASVTSVPSVERESAPPSRRDKRRQQRRPRDTGRVRLPRCSTQLS